jgi:hypothetical protein
MQALGRPNWWVRLGFGLLAMAAALLCPPSSRAVHWGRGQRGVDWSELLIRMRTRGPLTPAQEALRSKLEADLLGDLPTHRLTLQNHHLLQGQIVAETPAGIRLREADGYSGSIVSMIPRSDIVRIEKLPLPNLDVTDDDVRLASEFPGFHLVKSGVYSLVTDAPSSDAGHVIEQLAELRKEFVGHFAGLIQPQCQPRNFQVVYFDHEADYQGYVAWAAPGLENSAGFYSPSEDRLAFLDRFGSSQYAMEQRSLSYQQQRVANAAYLKPDSRLQISGQLAQIQAKVIGQARSDTTHVIRHEGAHQLFNAYGIVSLYNAEPTWLIEGMAQYCEPDEIGARHEGRAADVAAAQRTHQLMALKDLLGFRDPDGFFALGEPKVGIAYAESWALTYFLMQDGRRDGFIEFIKHYRDLRNTREADEVRAENVGQTLAKYLHTNYSQLEDQWQDFLKQLAPPTRAKPVRVTKR